MPLIIASLNSGSNGNCYYIGNDTDAVLVDVGISCRETEKRMNRIGLSMLKVRAIFVSHEHTDHIRGVPVLAKKYGLPVYVTAATQQHGRMDLQQSLVYSFTAHTAVKIGDLLVTGFPKFHDAADPHSFIISCGGTTVGVFTDIGINCERLTRYFKVCHAAFLEANYDEELLDKGRYPYYLKARIRGGRGHLSNRQALELFVGHRPAFMTHLLLSHLSKDNNCPELVHQLFSQQADGVEIVVASRYEESRVYRIGGTAKASRRPIHEGIQGVLFA